MVVKLTEIYNTKYFYLPIGKDLTYLFNTCVTLQRNPALEVNAGNAMLQKIFDCFRVGAEVKFDLAGGKFTSDMWPILLHAQSTLKLDLIDSAEPWRNAILAENAKRFSVYADGVKDTVQLPVLQQNEKTIDFVKALQKDVIYEVSLSYPQDIWVQLVVLIMIFRPSIKLYTCNREATVLEYVARKLTYADLQGVTEFYMVTKEGVQIVDTSKPFYVQRLGYTNLADAQAFASFVPTSFGNKQLKDDATFRSIANDCLHDLNKYKNARKVALSELF